MKKVTVIVSVLLFILLTLSACGRGVDGSAANSNSNEKETFLTPEGLWIVENYSDEERIGDYCDIESSVIVTDYSDDGEFRELTEKLIRYAKKYGLTEKQEHYEFWIKELDNPYRAMYFEEEGVPITVSAWTRDFAWELVGKTYWNNYVYEKPMEISADSYLQLMTDLGYSYELKDESGFGSVSYKFSRGGEKGGSLSIDSKGNVISINPGYYLSEYPWALIDMSMEEYFALSEDKNQAIYAECEKVCLDNLSASELFQEKRIAFILSENEIGQLYMGLKSLINEEINKNPSSVFYLCETDNHIVWVLFALGQVSISGIHDKEFYTASNFPDVRGGDEVHTATAKKPETKIYASLSEYADSSDTLIALDCTKFDFDESELIDTENNLGEIVTYEFDTYDGKHVVIDEANIESQGSLEGGDIGDVSFYEQIAPGKDVAYMWDGTYYYVEDYSRNLMTIAKAENCWR